MTPAEQRLSRLVGIPVQDHKMNIGRFTINYIEAGSGSPVLLIHGANIGWGQWYANIADLAKRFKVYAIDLPGCGGSTRINFRDADVETDFVNTVRGFIKKLALTDLAIVGHSFGAVIALKLALDKNTPVSKLVLVSPLGFSGYINPKQRLATISVLARLVARTAMRPTKRNIATFLKDSVHQKTAISEDFLDYFHEAVAADKRSHPLLFINGLTKRFKMKPELIMTKDIPHVSQPVLIVVGAKDHIVPIAKFKQSIKLIPGSKVVNFANSGHVPGLEVTKEFNHEVASFLGAKS